MLLEYRFSKERMGLVKVGWRYIWGDEVLLVVATRLQVA